MRLLRVLMVLLGQAVFLAGCAAYMPAEDGRRFASEPVRVVRVAKTSRPATPAFVHRPAAQTEAPVETTGSTFPAISEPMKPFTPEWYAREHAIDAELKRKTTICVC